ARSGNFPISLRFLQKSEIAALWGLRHLLQVELPVAAIGARRGSWQTATLAPRLEFLLLDQKIQTAAGHIQPDPIASFYQRQGAPFGGLGADVQHDGAKGGAAHPGIRYPHHVRNACPGELLGDRQVAGLRHPRSALGTGILQDQNAVARDRKGRIIDPFGQVLQVLEDDRGAFVAEEFWGSGGLLDDGALRSQVAAEDPEAAAVVEGLMEGLYHLLRPGRRGKRQFFTEGASADRQTLQGKLVLQAAQN